jgi:hypothetical protein
MEIIKAKVFSHKLETPQTKVVSHKWETPQTKADSPRKMVKTQ